MADSKKPQPVDLTRVKRYSVNDRPTKTAINRFGKPVDSDGINDFLDSLPDFLKAADLRAFLDHVARARGKNLPFHWMLGAHVIKVGLSPIIIDLMQRRIVTGLSFNCAGLIHDLELAFFGGTSEDVQKGLADGSFGMVEETSKLFRAVTDLAARDNLGLGEAGGRFINNENAPHRELCVFAGADALDVPVTVHVGIGTDTIAQHPEYDAAAMAAASHRDFRILADICRDLDNGGVVANIGSAVLLPEVFLKALTVARNLSSPNHMLVSANFDMITHYRPMENVVRRPTAEGGDGYNFVGHHEILLPLLAWALKAKITL